MCERSKGSVCGRATSVVPSRNLIVSRTFSRADLLGESQDCSGGVLTIRDQNDWRGSTGERNRGHCLLWLSRGVVDFGTAVTFDVISADGQVYRRADCPRLNAMTDYLHKRTALLPA